MLLPEGGQQAPKGCKSRKGKPLGVRLPLEDPSHQQKLPLGPRVVISFISAFVFLSFSTLGLICRHRRVTLCEFVNPLYVIDLQNRIYIVVSFAKTVSFVTPLC